MCGILLFAGKNHEVHCRENGLSLLPRGPDKQKLLVREKYSMYFTRLRIVGNDAHSMQPFSTEIERCDDETISDTICNGEIYNFKSLLRVTQSPHHPEFEHYRESMCDCEVIHQAHVSQVDNIADKLDGVFAYINVTDNVLEAARDPIGVRPLFIGYKDGTLGLSSEVKALKPLWPNVYPFPPGHRVNINLETFLSIQTWKPYCTPWLSIPIKLDITRRQAHVQIVDNLKQSVKKRLMSDRPIAALLSGGLDSSLICGLLSTLTDKPLHTFSIGLKGSPDLKHAQDVANHLKTIHTVVEVQESDFKEAVPKVIHLLETCDVTTIRASVPMYLLCKHIAEKTDFKVIFSGEGSDEISQGYLYFHRRPSIQEADKDSRRLIQDLHYFDVLRADRCTAGQGLELRVPFLDKKFVSYYMSLPDAWRAVGEEKTEKFLLREAFDKEMPKLIPKEVLWRKKDGFSDGVTAMEDKPWFEKLECKDDVTLPDSLPDTPEARYYYKIFHELYPGLDHLHPYTWKAQWGDGVISGRKV